MEPSLIIQGAVALATLFGYAFAIWKWVSDKLADSAAALAIEIAARKEAEAKLTAQLAAFELKVATTYVSSEHMAAAMQRVEAALSRLTDRLDRLLDETREQRRNEPR